MKLKNIIKIGSFVVAGTLPTASMAQVYMCQACPAGTYSDGTQTQCTPCPVGTYSTGGAGSCSKCNEEKIYWVGASCGTDTGTVVRYCTKSGSTSATANQATSTVTRYLGACQEVKKQCKVVRSCTQSVCGGKGITNSCGPGLGTKCADSTLYIDVGNHVKTDNKTIERGTGTNGDTVQFYTYKVYYTTSGSCDTAIASSCACK